VPTTTTESTVAPDGRLSDILFMSLHSADDDAYKGAQSFIDNLSDCSGGGNAGIATCIRR
jgi:hypothetical protein